MNISFKGMIDLNKVKPNVLSHNFSYDFVSTKMTLKLVTTRCYSIRSNFILQLLSVMQRERMDTDWVICVIQNGLENLYDAVWKSVFKFLILRFALQLNRTFNWLTKLP